MLKAVLKQFGFNDDSCKVISFGSGLINNTWQVEMMDNHKKFILQRVNMDIFKKPEDIAFNTRLIADYLKGHFPRYLFINSIQSIERNDLVITQDGVFRLFPFVENSYTYDVVEKPEQAYEAAKQFARFTKSLSGFDAKQLKITLPDFHNLSFRYDQFLLSLQNGNKERIAASAALIEFIHQQKDIVTEFEIIKKHILLRVTHHDTKISNVLFDEDGKGLCVIDLDTVMPGYFISDVGDMMRTYLSPVSEEEKDFSKICVRKDFYDAIINGYLAEMGEVLSDLEKRYFHYAGKFMIYMQTVRFLTDYINNDIYYGSSYEGHNLIRAGNQVALLKCLLEINSR